MKIKNSGMKYKTKRGSINIDKLILNLFLTLASIALIIFIFQMLFGGDDGGNNGNNSSVSSGSSNNSGWNSESIVIPPVEDPKWYDAAVSESAEVEDSYFENTVLIGNSTIEGIGFYSLLPEATVYAEVGLTVTNIFNEELSDGKTAFELIADGNFDKIYICLGLNELGWEYSDIFKERYESVIEEIRTIAPDAEIYIQSILPVAVKKTEADPIFNNTKIEEYNTLISEICKEQGLHLIYYPEEILTPEGTLLDEASTDGVHLTRSYLSIYADYLKTHTTEE